MTTVELPPLAYEPPKTIDDLRSQAPSEVGNSAIASWLTCQESARLRALGVRRKVKQEIEGAIAPMDELAFGSLYHALSATRSVHGMVTALGYLESLRVQLASEDYLLAFHMLKTNDVSYPLERDAEQFDLLGVEVEVRTDMRARDNSQLVRTVRYDKIIRLHSDLRGKGVYSLEVKTSSRGGESALSIYLPQRAAHAAIWNCNTALVERYGPLHGTIYEQISKTKLPQCQRFGPYYASKRHARLWQDYSRLPDETVYYALPDGSYPRQLHACFGRFRPCQYISLCWDNAVGDYLWP